MQKLFINMLTRTELKNWLLQDSNFIDNECLDQYIELIAENYNLSTDLYTEKHHVKPVVCYKKLYGCKTRKEAQKFAENDKNNSVVKLLYKDHCKAHWLLYWCTKSAIRTANAWTLQYMQAAYKKCTGKDKRKIDFNEADFELLAKYLEQIYADSDNVFWTTADIDILKKYYPKLGAAGVQPKLTYFRSSQAIRMQASLLKLSAPIFWTEEETALLRQYYPIEGYFCYKRFENKSKSAVQGKAHRLSLPSVWNWTDSELQTLKAWYPIEGNKCSSRIPHKSIVSIAKKAAELKLQKPDFSHWSSFDTAILIEYYPSLGIKCRDKFTKYHTEGSIYNKVRSLKLKKASSIWTPENTELIIENYPNFAVIFAHMPDVSKDCIYSKVKDLKKKGLIQTEKRADMS